MVDEGDNLFRLILPWGTLRLMWRIQIWIVLGIPPAAGSSILKATIIEVTPSCHSVQIWIECCLLLAFLIDVRSFAEHVRPKRPLDPIGGLQGSGQHPEIFRTGEE